MSILPRPDGPVNFSAEALITFGGATTSGFGSTLTLDSSCSLIIEMTNSIIGIENLKNTYSKDILISSQLDIIKKKMLMKIEKLNKLFSINITKYY